jgi:hypothetical protein
MPTTKDLKALEATITTLSQQILGDLRKQTGGDVHLAIAALAFAMCALAHTSGVSRAKMQQCINIAQRAVGEPPASH